MNVSNLYWRLKEYAESKCDPDMYDTKNDAREVAKALLIDSAAGWKKNLLASKIAGYGIVPKDITKIIQSEDDEIQRHDLRAIEYQKTTNFPFLNDAIPCAAAPGGKVSASAAFPEAEYAGVLEYSNIRLLRCHQLCYRFLMSVFISIEEQAGSLEKNVEVSNIHIWQDLRSSLHLSLGQG